MKPRGGESRGGALWESSVDGSDGSPVCDDEDDDDDDSDDDVVILIVHWDGKRRQ